MVSNIVLTAYTWATTRLAMLKEERGQDIMEYAVIVGAIALIAFGALTVLDTDASFEEFTTAIENCITFDEECGTTN